ncbi:(d)CMP kinase [Candidatus Magnetominusculus dajiuhuensis]|uniref:(d)CMP kinase n=1 Tax=Candidatus Magnetominusculus dajiuhuensis TaxID=3137712 RepID=UPI003B42C52F
MTNTNGKGKVIAIDGPAGSGKSTVARALAALMGFDYLDTGALYRAAAIKLVSAGVSEDSGDDLLSSVLRGTLIEFKNGVVYLDGKDVSEEIRTPEAGHYSSVFSAMKPVRDFLLEIQRNVGGTNGSGGIVAEGRDMATVVFPEAWRKFYVTADEPTRAQRRYAQLRKKNAGVTLSTAQSDVASRDDRDTKRAIAPLTKAPGAIEIDTTNLSIEETLERIMREL